MAFEIAGIFKRSITIERINNARFKTDEKCTVYVDGQPYCETDRNVITIDGLEPDHEYEIRVKDGGSDECTAVKTQTESFLLDVRRFGAAGDGNHNDTAAIQAAIQSCPDNGTVWIPRGTYYTGPLFLKSHMTFWVDEGAVILGDAKRENYPVLPGIIRHLYDNKKEYNLSSWEGNPLDSYASLLTAIGVEGLDIVGRGTIDGNASNCDWWIDPKVKRVAWRPKLIFFNACKNVRMQGLSLQNSPCWCVHPYYSDELDFLDLTIQNPPDSPNTDGFDPESCENVRLLGTTISVGDDCIAIKSGKLYMANAHHKETKNIVIRNCHMKNGHGSVTVGSEIAGGVRGLHVTHCIFSGTDRGVRIKTRRGRGDRSVLTDLLFENITMNRVHMPVTVNMFYYCDPDGHSEYVQSQEPMEKDYRTPRIGSLTVRYVDCMVVDVSLVCAYGLPEAPIEKLTLEHIKAYYLPENERTPRCPIMMDNFPKLSGRGLYLKNVDRLQVNDVTIYGSADKESMLTNVNVKEIKELNYR